MAALCPAALAALELAPQPVIPGRAPIALFSRLTPGTHIQPHHGMLNTRLICHLPLIVPDGCALRVGAETRGRSEEHTSELQSLMRISYAVFCLKKKNRRRYKTNDRTTEKHS